MTDIAAALGAGGVITEAAEMARFLDDPLGLREATPRAILRPSSTAEVQQALQWCREEDLAVIPQGGLTGLTSAAVPGAGRPAAIISFGRMNRIRSIDAAGNTMTVEAGAVLADVRAAAEAEGRYFPLFHGAVGSAQIGGNLSTNSGGNNALRYGTARDQVLGLEVVLADGTVWNGLKALRKNTAGYDLKQLFIGAEGTLGLITAAVLKLRAFPANRATAFLAVESPAAALALLHALERHLGETLAAFELLSGTAIGFALALEGVRQPLAQRAAWAVLLEVETPARGFDLAAALENGLAEAFEAGQVLDAVIAQNEAQRQEFWHLRESIATAFVEDKSSHKSDTAVPVGEVPAFLAAASAAVLAYLPGTRIAPFGHVGDGNIHFNLVRPETMAPEEFWARGHELAAIIAETTLAHGGTISAEHGVGRLKRPEMERFGDKVTLALMARLKTALDPEGRLNPGVYFDRPL